MSGKAALASFLWLTAPFAYAQPDLAPARSALAEFSAVCAAEGSKLWGVPLCDRIVIVDPRSRRAVGSVRDPEKQFTEREGLFEGILPPQFLLANTSIHWGADEWAMVMLPLPQDKFSRIRLLAHESFHRAQKELKLNASDAPNAHLDTESGRLWLRLELRALAQALRSSDAAGRQATSDALLFRATRRSMNPGADRNENALEIQEGLAEYTGNVIALSATGESIARVARGVEAFEDQTAYSRSFAYATGSALGLLLDRYAPEWRSALTTERGMSDLLAKAALKPGPDLASRAQQRAAAYGYQAVAEDEQVRESRRRLQTAAYRARFLDGPILQFPSTAELQRSFNPGNLVTLGEAGTVYPTGTFTSRWGCLQVDEIGALLSPDNQSLRVSAPADVAAKPLTGPGWRFELAPGWTIRPSAKAGNFDVVPQP